MTIKCHEVELPDATTITLLKSAQYSGIFHDPSPNSRSIYVKYVCMSPSTSQVWSDPNSFPEMKFKSYFASYIVDIHIIYERRKKTIWTNFVADLVIFLGGDLLSKCNFGSLHDINPLKLSIRFFSTEKINDNFPESTTLKISVTTDKTIHTTIFLT